MELREKIIHIRTEEGLNQKEFSQLVGIPHRSLGGFERGEQKNLGDDNLLKITKHPRFKKYTMLLMTDEQPGKVFSEYAASYDEFSTIFEKLSDEKAAQTLEYMKFLLSQEGKG